MDSYKNDDFSKDIFSIKKSLYDHQLPIDELNQLIYTIKNLPNFDDEIKQSQATTYIYTSINQASPDDIAYLFQNHCDSNLIHYFLSPDCISPSSFHLLPRIFYCLLEKFPEFDSNILTSDFLCFLITLATHIPSNTQDAIHLSEQYFQLSSVSNFYMRINDLIRLIIKNYVDILNVPWMIRRYCFAYLSKQLNERALLPILRIINKLIKLSTVKFDDCLMVYDIFTNLFDHNDSFSIIQIELLTKIAINLINKGEEYAHFFCERVDLHSLFNVICEHNPYCISYILSIFPALLMTSAGTQVMPIIDSESLLDFVSGICQNYNVQHVLESTDSDKISIDPKEDDCRNECFGEIEYPNYLNDLLVSYCVLFRHMLLVKPEYINDPVSSRIIDFLFMCCNHSFQAHSEAVTTLCGIYNIGNSKVNNEMFTKKMIEDIFTIIEDDFSDILPSTLLKIKNEAIANNSTVILNELRQQKYFDVVSEILKYNDARAKYLVNLLELYSES
ncbi:hypothetical protein TRFO_18436 [Tritrichomonas foetus]|uniref:Uncharacterized protein n=1 Tax=Tritrichomonas foetus TaxID=1144522 RepID=A0A1J4KQI5_9EUKA|nr:hypothetical protein TRFO_18436 [Tritrichomonas foetus]|eukprot:OHT11950.1 hypothetical protein TRFO_18436 [Tritrichomonas foetus]